MAKGKPLDEKFWRDYNNLPRKIMEHQFRVVHKGCHKSFLDSIQWDSVWLKHDTPEEKRFKEITRQFNSHPFKKWIAKPKELIES